LLVTVMSSSAFWADKGVLLTGASSGLGEALAKDLSGRGATLVLASRRVEKLNTVADACVTCSPHAKKPAVLPLDLCDDAAALELKAAEAEAMLGEMQVNVLICCAGVAQRSAAAQTSAKEHARIMSQFEGHVALTRALLPPMLARGGGSIAVVSSVQGFFGQPYRSSYAAAKAALVGYYDSLRAEVAHQGIKVTVVAPGYIATEHAASAVGGNGELDDNAKSGMAADELARRVADAIEAGEAQLVPAPFYAQAAMLFRAIWPSGFFGYMERKARKS